MMLPGPTAATLLVIEVLDTPGVPYLIGGSVASAIHGVARAGMDADLADGVRLNREPRSQL